MKVVKVEILSWVVVVVVMAKSSSFQQVLERENGPGRRGRASPALHTYVGPGVGVVVVSAGPRWRDLPWVPWSRHCRRPRSCSLCQPMVASPALHTYVGPGVIVALAADEEQVGRGAVYVV